MDRTDRKPTEMDENDAVVFLPLRDDYAVDAQRVYLLRAFCVNCHQFCMAVIPKGRSGPSALEQGRCPECEVTTRFTDMGQHTAEHKEAGSPPWVRHAWTLADRMKEARAKGAPAMEADAGA